MLMFEKRVRKKFYLIEMLNLDLHKFLVQQLLPILDKHSNQQHVDVLDVIYIFACCKTEK